MTTLSYTSIYQAVNDVNMYVKRRTSHPLTLANIQAIAKARWVWIINNWEKTLKKSFKDATGGDEGLESKFEDFQRFITSYKLGNLTNPIDSLQNFVQISPFLDLISLASIQLSPDEAALRDIEIDRIDNLDIENFQSIIKFLRTKSAERAQLVGLGDPDAAKLLGIQQKPRQRSASIQDLEDISQIDSFRVVAEKLLFGLMKKQKRPPNVLALSNQFIDPSSAVFFDGKYKSYVPTPFEISLEHMAEKFLGSRKLWFTLVTVNNLQPPYIDEAGEKFPLLAPAAVNNLIISDARATDIPVGTKIGLGSYRFREEARIVERVLRNENGTMILFLSGAQNVSRFKPNEGAFVRIYAPHTVRKGSFVLIPLKTNSAISTSIPTPDSDELRRLDKSLLQFGVDIARDERSGDIVFDPTGNFKKAAGLANVRQSILTALKTVRGELPFHPNYGLNTNIGGRFFGSTDEALVFAELLRDTLMADKRFTNIQIARVATTGTGIALTIIVTIAGSNQPLPLSFIS